MAKTKSTRSRKSQSKAVTSKAVEEDSVNADGQTGTVLLIEHIVGTEEDGTTDTADQQDSLMDTVIEVKGSTPTVTVSWGKKNEADAEGDDSKKRPKASDQMTAKIMHSGSTPTESATCEEKNRKGKGGQVKEETNKSEHMTGKEKSVNGKRTAGSNVEASPSKKPKIINDGFCLFVGNLNNSKTFEEVRDSLDNYFMAQSLLVQQIRLNPSKKYAYVDLASNMDLSKALSLNGEVILDKPVKMAKAKVKSEDKVTTQSLDKKVKDGRCLFLKNVPYNATKTDILKVFDKAIAVRFPGGAKGPTKGIAFVEFLNKTIARKALLKKQRAKIQDRVLIVDCVGETKVSKKSKVTQTNDNDGIKAVPPSNTLFVSNLPFRVTEHKLKKVFQKAVGINVPQSQGKSKGFAFVEFASVTDAEKALQLCHNMKIYKRAARLQFCEMREKPENGKVQSKTLIVKGLAQRTTAETLKRAFEGAINTRVAVDKDTGISKSFGFVDFESEENCKAVKAAMEDCEIDGSKVTIAYAKSKDERGCQGARGGMVGHPGGQSAGRGPGRGGHGGRGGRRPGAGMSQPAAKEVQNKS